LMTLVFGPNVFVYLHVTMSDVSPTYVKTEHFRISDTNGKGRRYLSTVWRLAQTLTKLPGETEGCAELYCA
jgi:hypothetical protein